MSIDQSYPWYINDWLGSSTRAVMSAEERGIYRDLLDACWRDGSLPAHEDTLQRIACVTDIEWRRSWPAVRDKFEARDGRLWNSKVDSKRPEIVKAKEDRRAGGRARSSTAQRANGKFAPAENQQQRQLPNQQKSSLAGAVAGKFAPAENQPPPSPSPSPYTLPSVGENTLPDSPGISPAPRKTAPGGSVSSLALAVSADTEPERLAREWIGTFVAAGVALSEADVMRALRGVGETKGFLSHTLDEQRAIVAYTQVKAPTVTAQYLGLPVNLLAKGEWRRRAGPRLLAAPTNSPEGKAEATRRALHERLVRDARERNG